MNNDILFAKIHFKSFDRNLATQEIMNIESKYWFWDSFRGTNMIPLMTIDSQTGIEGSSLNRNGTFSWVEYTPTVLRDWFETEVFPWMGCKTRIMALLTHPGVSNLEHMDSDIKQLGTRQHKFRVILQGRTDTLYFKTQTGDVHVPDIVEPFIMDGSWPHGMTNDSNEFKLTIAAGAPWTGNDSYDNVDVLMKRSTYALPNDLTPYLKVDK